MSYSAGLLEKIKSRKNFLSNTPSPLTIIGSFLMVLLILTFSGCEFSTDASGYAAPSITVKGIPPDIEEVALIVSGPDMGTIEIRYPGLPTSITAEVPSGEDRQFELLAFVKMGAAFPGYRGTSTADLEPGGEQNLTINMKIAGKIYVANWSDDTVSVIDGGTNTVIKTIPVGTGPVAGPGGVGVNTATGKVYVANDQDTPARSVSVIDSSSDTVIKTFGIATSSSSLTEPFFVGVNPNANKIYVSQFYQGDDVHVINGATDSVITSVATPGSYTYGVGVNSITNKIYVARWNPAGIIDGSSNGYLGEVSGGSWSDCRGVGVNPNTNKIYIADDTDVHVVNGSTNSEMYTITVGNVSFGIGVNEITNKIYVANFSDDTVSVINGSTDSVIKTIPVGASPMGVAVNSYNNRIYVTNKDSNNVTVIDGATDTVVTTVSVGTNPSLLDVMP
jgi:YVTN family beta-propeller protein